MQPVPSLVCTFSESVPAQPEPQALTSTRVLQRGADGADVRNLQSELNLRGASLEPDGDFGPRTQAALRDFQRRSGIAPDGATRHTTGTVRTTSQNGGRGPNGFFHAEFHSVNDTEATDLIKARPQEYARILGETLGRVPGANFIVPHGNINRQGITDPGAVSRDGWSSPDLVDTFRKEFVNVPNGQEI